MNQAANAFAYEPLADPHPHHPAKLVSPCCSAYSNEVIFMLQGSAVAGIIITIIDLDRCGADHQLPYYSPFGGVPDSRPAHHAAYLRRRHGCSKKWEARWRIACVPAASDLIQNQRQKFPQLRQCCSLKRNCIAIYRKTGL